MKTITIDIKDELITRVCDSFIVCYPPSKETDVSTDSAKIEYVRSLLIKHIKDVVGTCEANEAVEQARQAALNTNIVIN